jgi:hypothetical protein
VEPQSSKRRQERSREVASERPSIEVETPRGRRAERLERRIEAAIEWCLGLDRGRGIERRIEPAVERCVGDRKRSIDRRIEPVVEWCDRRIDSAIERCLGVDRWCLERCAEWGEPGARERCFERRADEQRESPVEWCVGFDRWHFKRRRNTSRVDARAGADPEALDKHALVFAVDTHEPGGHR